MDVLVDMYFTFYNAQNLSKKNFPILWKCFANKYNQCKLYLCETVLFYLLLSLQKRLIYKCMAINVKIFFYFQPLYVVNDIRELKCLCAEDEQSRSCWVTALRIVRVSNLLKYLRQGVFVCWITFPAAF